MKKKTTLEDNTQPNNQTALTIDEFKSKMQGYGYHVMSWSDENEVNYKLYTVNDYDISLEIKFLICSDITETEKWFDLYKSQIENYNYGKKEVELSEKSKISAIIDNQYYVFVSKIDNTIVNLSVDYKYKDKAKDIINNLGY